MNWIRLARTPVRIDAIAMTVVTPITMPSTVRKLRNLCARTLSSAISTVSAGTNEFSFTIRLSQLGQCDDRIESGSFDRRIDSEDHADAARHYQRKQNIGQSYRHRNWGGRPDQPRDAGGHHEPEDASERAQHG